ncbi:MAG: flagellar hook-associated protein FlgL [Pseudomonadota bacterium]|nr:flagellar hook-associated protein FlgL [Pseudomonadota bacterium]
MRVATSSAQQQALQALLDQQAKLLRTQQQIASGVRFTTAAQDPLGAARVSELGGALAELARYQGNIDRAEGSLQLEEDTLAAAGDVLNRARELTLQANSGVQDAAGREAIAAELAGLQADLLALANTTDGNGNYLFGGYASQQAPFVRTAGEVSYRGDQGQPRLALGEGRQIAIGDSGEAVFMRVRPGNGQFVAAPAATNTGTGRIGPGVVTDATLYANASFEIRFTAADAYEVRDGGGGLIAAGPYVAGEPLAVAGISVTIEGAPAAGDGFSIEPARAISAFDVLDGALAAVLAPAGDAAGAAQQQQAYATALAGFDSALGELNEIRAGIGSRLTTLDRQRLALEDTGLELERLRSQTQDLDIASAVSQLNLDLVGLEAAQAAFTRIQNLSLFRFLG